MSYFEKYLKYKSKYLRLKQLLNNESQVGGGKKDILEIDALSDTPTNLEAFGIDMEDFPYLPKFTGGGNEENKEEKEENNEEKEKKTIELKSETESTIDSDSEESKNSTVSNSEIETDSVLSSSDEEQEGGGFFGNLMDELSSSVKSFDLQKGGYDDDDDELSPLSEDETIQIQ
jgi:hypothetical protein